MDGGALPSRAGRVDERGVQTVQATTLGARRVLGNPAFDQASAHSQKIMKILRTVCGLFSPLNLLTCGNGEQKNFSDKCNSRFADQHVCSNMASDQGKLGTTEHSLTHGGQSDCGLSAD